jgi:hypothetical protein
MAKYLDLFPKIAYDPTKTLYSTNFNTVTNILFRIGIIKEYVNNTTAYYDYVIQDGEKPEILAERFYGSPEAHWIIILANDIVDPQYDWPLNYDEFNNYIIGKYGSVANAKTTIHHYEKVVTREESTTGSFFTYRYVVDYDRKSDGLLNLSDVTGAYSSGEAVYQGTDLANATFSANVVSWTPNILQVANTVGKVVRYTNIKGDTSSANGTVTSFGAPTAPYDTYLSLPDEQTYQTYSVGGKTIIESISRNSVSNYDYEVDQNESKREIKIIKSEYYRQLVREFEDLVLPDDFVSYLRTIR